MSGPAVAAGAAVPALGRVWLNELMARCEREGLALPGGPQLHHTVDDVPSTISFGAIMDTTYIVMLSVWELAG